MSKIGLARGVALGTIAWCLGTPLYAQQAPAPAGDEIIVTATRRADNLLNVPVSVTAVTAAAIERTGAKNMEDLARTVPGLAVQPTDEQSDKTFVIRGVGGGSTSGGGVQSSTVAVYLDDTPITFGSSNPDLKLFDVKQVEVLRGPQGTLFGSSSMGGSIRYTSPQPSDHFTGMVRGEASATAHGAPSYEGQAMVSGPLAGDSLTFRASGFYRRDGGYVDLRDETNGALIKKNQDTQKSWGGRIAVRAQIAPGFDANLSAIYQKIDSDGLPTFFSGRGVTTTVALPPLSRVDRAPAYRNDRVFLPNLTLNGDLGFARLTSSSSYVQRKLNVYSDFSYYVQNALGLPDPSNFSAPDIENRNFRAFVQEVRLASKGGGPFNWLIGGYFRDTRESAPQDVQSNLASVVPALAPAVLANGSLYLRTLHTHRQQYAAFGEVSYKLFDALTLTAGLRWTELKQKVDRSADGLFNGGFTSSILRTDEKPVTPKFSAQYQIAPRAMVYATVAKGFREGGPNESVPAGLATCAAALHSLGLTAAPTAFNTDSVWSYEIGTKFETADHRLRATAAAYTINWNGIQEVINLTGGCGFSYIDNIGKARSRGFELEATVRPVDGLSIDLSAGYTDARLTQDLISGATSTGPVIAAPRGTTLPDVPKWTFRAAPQVDFGLSGDLRGFARADAQYIGKSKRTLNTPTDDPRVLDRSSYVMVNLRFGLIRGKDEVNLFVNNLFDDDTLIYKSYANFAPGTAFEGTQLRPRVIGVSYKRGF